MPSVFAPSSTSLLRGGRPRPPLALPRAARRPAGPPPRRSRSRATGPIVVTASSRRRRKAKPSKRNGATEDLGDGTDGDRPGHPSVAPVAAASDPRSAPRATRVSAPSAAAARGEGDADGAPQPTIGTTPLEEEALPAVTRDQVLDSCLGSTAWMLGIGVVLREGTFFGRDALPDGIPDLTASLPLVAALHPPFAPADLALHAAVAGAAAAAVTAARTALLDAWPDFRTATDRSNAQVLTPLNKADVVTVSVLPAVAEETLFRGVLLPALGGGPLGVVASGAVFGALHLGGGRNAAFAAWASAVGCLYGACAAYTGDVAVAMLAHAIANVASATTWLEKNDVELR